LVDTAGVTVALQKHLGAATVAAEFSTAWRQKQLEYTFRYTAMGVYRDFRVCTRQALDYCCAALRVELSARARDALMNSYLKLPAFDDVADGLKLLAGAGAESNGARPKLFAFSNGHPDDLQQLLANAGLAAHLDGVISVHDARAFKPAPAVYQHFLDCADAAAGDTWLVSGNPFDIIGARAAGWHALWLRRSPATVFDPWQFQPTATVTNFTQVAQRFVGPTRHAGSLPPQSVSGG